MRFPEFSGEWVTCTLGDITSSFNLRNKDEVPYPMYSVTNNRGFIPQSEQFEDREMIGEDAKAYKIIYKDDFAYNPARINVGSIAKYNGVHPCMISSLYVCFKAGLQVDKDWLMQLLKTSKMNFYYNINGEGGVRVYLFYPNFARIRTSYPATLTEQKKIAHFLSLLDERIATQNKIIEKLQSLIKGLSQQLLSSENDWILYRLDDLAQIKSGYSGTQVSYQTPYKVSRIETISKHCIDIQRIGYVECIPESYRLNVGNILFSNINSIQYIGNTAYLDKDYGLYHGMNLLRIIPNTTIVRPRFLHLLLCTDWAINHFQTICNKAVSQASINQTALGKSRFPIPPMSVQQQICSMFELTERKLDNEQEYISCLQQQKRYLLQKMFI